MLLLLSFRLVAILSTVVACVGNSSVSKPSNLCNLLFNSGVNTSSVSRFMQL